MATASEHQTQLSDPQASWFCGQSAPGAHLIPWAACSMNAFQQACAVPFRRKGKRLEFCLITSSAGRWMFPKGVIDPGDTPVQTARKEALEEAGLHGRVRGKPLGSYQTRKSGRDVTVVVVLLEVTRADDTWEEDHRRQRCWVGREAARKLLDRHELHDCLEAALTRLTPESE